LGLNSDDVSDNDILPYIEDAQRDMLKDISHYVQDDKLSGSNNTFSTTYPYIAHSGFGLTFSPLDIQVYGWTNEEDPTTKTSLSVNNIYGTYGKVVLSSIPPTYAKVTADYYYYDSPITSDQFSDACAILAAFYYALSEIILMPKQWMHGAYRFMKTDSVAELEVMYWNRIHKILGRMDDVATHGDITYLRGTSYI
jgi:hypothetical protein